MATSTPGTVIHHVAAHTHQYIGCPSIVLLPGGELLASHSYFGPGARNTDTYLYRSQDGGTSWTRITELRGQIWSNLFLHRDSLYIMGTDHCDRYGGRLNGRVVIRRSDDRGKTWSTPKDGSTGVLCDEDGYHTAPVPVVVHGGRIWRAFEYAPQPDRRTWQAFVLFADETADLLDCRSWKSSERYTHLWSESQWIEGNVVVAPDGQVVDILRSNYMGDDPARAADEIDRAVLLHVDDDGSRLFHDRAQDIIDFPGGGSKFTIRRDPLRGRYWSLTNKQKDPPARRNGLYLISSHDLRTWKVERPLLSHPDPEYHAFQYVDWIFDGDDILFVSRTAWEDEDGGAHNYHDANFLTFHRAGDFRDGRIGPNR